MNEMEGYVENLWLLELCCTAALFGLIWVIQLVHYPSFAYVATARFAAFHRMHTRQITLIVLPLMVGELGISAFRCWQAAFDWTTIVPFAIVLFIWGSTFWVQVPLHAQLAQVQDQQLIKRLVATNWWRTLGWTVRLGWLIFLAE